MILVAAMHITAAVFVNDDEPGLHQDIDDWLQRRAPGPAADVARGRITATTEAERTMATPTSRTSCSVTRRSCR